jgi:uncharacterized protein YnzC (UPF0291/DUF896 family)
MITDEDKARLGDLAMRAIDKVIDEYGEDATLKMASLVFEVKVVDEDGDDVYHVNYESFQDATPNHVGGMYYGMAHWLLTPTPPSHEG